MSLPRLSRRTLLGAGTAAALCAPSLARAAPDHIVVASPGGAMDDAFDAAYYKPFTAKTGIAVVKTPNQYAKLKAMVDAKAVEWDVMDLAADQAALFARQDLLDPFDTGVIDPAGLLPGTLHPHYTLVDLVGAVICWNTKRVTPAAVPRSWAEVWDLKRFPGDRMLWKKASETLEVALLADGVEPAKLYPLDVPRALRSLDRIKNQVSWWESGAQSAQLLIDGEASAGLAWNGRLDGPRSTGAPIDFSYDQAVFLADAMVIPKGAKNKKESMQFISFVLEPANQAEFARRIPYGPVRTAAMDQLDPARRTVLPTAPDNFKKGVLMDSNWWADHGPDAVEKFNTWLLA